MTNVNPARIAGGVAEAVRIGLAPRQQFLRCGGHLLLWPGQFEATRGHEGATSVVSARSFIQRAAGRSTGNPPRSPAEFSPGPWSTPAEKARRQSNQIDVGVPPRPASP
jgi:hypothetical protein